jgi:hypothetical protein
LALFLPGWQVLEKTAVYFEHFFPLCVQGRLSLFQRTREGECKRHIALGLQSFSFMYKLPQKSDGWHFLELYFLFHENIGAWVLLA